MTPWTLSIDEDVFGKDAMKFNPDRWLRRPNESEDAFQERLRKMKRADLVWGHGPRSCIGKPIAQLEMYKLVPTLFGLFDVSVFYVHLAFFCFSFLFRALGRLLMEVLL